MHSLDSPDHLSAGHTHLSVEGNIRKSRHWEEVINAHQYVLVTHTHHII